MDVIQRKLIRAGRIRTNVVFTYINRKQKSIVPSYCILFGNRINNLYYFSFFFLSNKMKIYLVFGVEADQNDDDPLGLVTTSLISYIRWFPLLTGGKLLVLALMICIYAIPSFNHRSWTNEYV